MSESSSATERSCKIGKSKTAKAMLCTLGFIYALGGIAAFGALRESLNPQLREKLLMHGVQHTVVAVILIVACILALKRRKAADLCAGIAVATTGLAAIKALGTAIHAGFHVYHLGEPLVILPSLSYIAWIIARPQSPTKTG